MYELDLYETENGRIPINEYLKELRDENQLAALTKIKAYTEMLTEHGFQINDYRPNAIKKINKEYNIWELIPGDSRVFFFSLHREKAGIVARIHQEVSKDTSSAN